MTLDTQLNAYIETQSQAATDRAVILSKAKEVENFTTQEIAIMLGWEYHHVQPRVSQLVDKDRLIDTGQRREGREKLSAVWAYNPNPQPRLKRPKHRGDKALWNKMMDAKREQQLHPRADTNHKIIQLAGEWILASKFDL